MEAKRPRGNPNMRPGAPSVNPAGRAFSAEMRSTVAKRATAVPAGTDGVISYGGMVTTGESNSELTGPRKWLTLTNTINYWIVSTGVRYTCDLLAGTEWHAEINPSGDPGAERGVDIVREGLLEAPLSRPWPMVVSKSALFMFLGFSLHACGIKRRADGMIVYSDLAHRPQHTIDGWHRASDRDPWESVTQRTNAGKEHYISLDECFYLVDDTLTDSPEGVGLLRHVVETVRRLGIYEGLEGSGFLSDMGGLPIARAPIAEIVSQLGGQSSEVIAANISSATSSIVGAVNHRIKTPEKQQWLMLDSAKYDNGAEKWGLEIVRTETNGLAEVNAVIARLQLEIARVLGIEFAMVGGGDSAGTYGMHADKTSLFAAKIENTLNEIATAATRQLARRLVALNGLDPDTCCPRLVAEPISTDAILTVTQALANISAAGLASDDPARAVLRKRMRLPPEPDRTADLMAPRVIAPDDLEDVDVDDDEIDDNGEAA